MREQLAECADPELEVDRCRIYVWLIPKPGVDFVIQCLVPGRAGGEKGSVPLAHVLQRSEVVRIPLDATGMRRVPEKLAQCLSGDMRLAESLFLVDRAESG